jgi:hypothetical protein
MCLLKDYFLIVLLFLFARGVVPLYAQHQENNFTGIILDSATAEAVPEGLISFHAHSLEAISDDKGHFSIHAFFGDTLYISRLGYHPKKLVIKASSGFLIIWLRPQVMELQPVTIYGKVKLEGSNKWKDYIKIPDPYTNKAQQGNLVQTFGAGYTFTGPISYFLKSEKEKRKLVKLKSYHKEIKVYSEIITSPSLKQELQTKFSLSDEAYYQKIERFNKAYPEASRLTDEKEIVNLLYYFFALESKQD